MCCGLPHSCRMLVAALEFSLWLRVLVGLTFSCFCSPFLPVDRPQQQELQMWASQLLLGGWVGWWLAVACLLVLILLVFISACDDADADADAKTYRREGDDAGGPSEEV